MSLFGYLLQYCYNAIAHRRTLSLRFQDSTHIYPELRQHLPLPSTAHNPRNIMWVIGGWVIPDFGGGRLLVIKSVVVTWEGRSRRGQGSSWMWSVWPGPDCGWAGGRRAAVVFHGCLWCRRERVPPCPSRDVSVRSLRRGSTAPALAHSLCTHTTDYIRYFNYINI